MKTIGKITILIASMMVVSMGIALGGETKEIKIKTSAQCDNCKERIEKALAFEKGVKKSTLDVKTKECTVIYNPKKTSPEKIKAAIAKSGYDADEVKAEDKAYNKLPRCCQKGGHE